MKDVYRAEDVRKKIEAGFERGAMVERTEDRMTTADWEVQPDPTEGDEE